MNTFAIRTQSLSRSFGSVLAVDNLSIEIPSGTVFGFLGPNGAGKTTTIRLLLGLLEPTAGQAEVLGFDTVRQADQIRQRTGALLEHNGLYERLSAEDNLEFYGRVWHIPAKEREARKKEILTQMGLWERRKDLVGKWSRGMKQKLAVARALFHRPSLLFLDEPTAGLDPVAAAALREDLAALVEQEGITVFLTTHNLSEAEKLCHQVGVIRQGKLLTIGAPNDLRSRKGANRCEVYGSGFSVELVGQLHKRPEVTQAKMVNQHLVIDLNGQTEIAGLVNWMVNAGAQIEEIRKSAASLEEVFLTLVEEQND
jgi:ABC-2 type transport system ATP-binding protein